MRRNRDIERFHICRRCEGTNTEQVGSHENADWNVLVYVGYCRDCHDDYGYNVRLETIEDKEGRI